MKEKKEPSTSDSSMSAAKYFDPRLMPKNVVRLPVQKSVFLESSFNTEGITGRSGVLVHATPSQKQPQVLLRGGSVPGHALLCRPKTSFQALSGGDDQS